VLPYLDVPPDVPVTAKLVRPPISKNFGSAGTSLDDFILWIECNAARCAKFTALARTEPKPPSVTVELDEGRHCGTGFREKQCAKLPAKLFAAWLIPLIGTSLAQDQSPAAGAKVRRGAKLRCG